MSNLYMKAKSDTCKQKTMTGNHDLTVEIFYGSAADSKKAIEIEVISQFTDSVPLIRIDCEEINKWKNLARYWLTRYEEIYNQLREIVNEAQTTTFGS